MTMVRQISATISPATKARLDAYLRANGLKQAHVIEEALLHHLEALDSLPATVVVPPRLVVDRAQGRRLASLISEPPEATPALQALFDDEG
ncbi:MAG: hypothetical protein ABIJ09_17655 [Pseudomonadota bacterium]